MIAGGLVSGSPLSSVEVYPNSNGCSLPPLPEPRSSPATFLTSGPNPVIATCGGLRNGRHLASCLVLDPTNWRWEESLIGDLRRARASSEVARINSAHPSLVICALLTRALSQYQTPVFLLYAAMTFVNLMLLFPAPQVTKAGGRPSPTVAVTQYMEGQLPRLHQAWPKGDHCRRLAVGWEQHTQKHRGPRPSDSCDNLWRRHGPA